MSTLDWIDSASEAFSDTLGELLAEGSLTLDPAEAGRRAALRTLSGSVWTDQVGPFYDTDGVMGLLGGITKQAVHDRVRRHRLLALRTGSGRLVYPTGQFDGQSVLHGIGAALEVILPDDTESWAVASWLATPDSALSGSTPLESLKAGELDRVVDAARQLAITFRG
jgi:hypothetical protein